MKEDEDGWEGEDYVRGGGSVKKVCRRGNLPRQQELRSSGDSLDINTCKAQAESPLGWDGNCLADPTASTSSEVEALGLGVGVGLEEHEQSKVSKNG